MSTDVIINVFVIYYNQLSNDRDFLFEFQCRRHFDENDDVFVYIVDVNLNYVMIRNTIDLFVHLRNRDRLKTITKYNQQICYNFTSNVDFLIIDDYFNKKSIKLWKKRLNTIVIATTYAISIAFETIKSFSFFVVVNSIFNVSTIQSLSITIDFQLKIVFSIDIIVYDNSNVIIQLIAMIEKFFII